MIYLVGEVRRVKRLLFSDYTHGPRGSMDQPGLCSECSRFGVVKT